MADSEGRKILGNIWASGGTAEREDPTTAASDGRVLNIEEGWPSQYSLADGDRLRRKVWNQIFRQLDGAASDAQLGLQTYDENIDYPQHAQVSDGVNTYRALVANGPTIGNATVPTALNQNIWEGIGGVARVPDTPLEFRVVAGNGGLEWWWRCGCDNGSAITGFVFEWRRAGQPVWTRVPLTHSFYRTMNLDNGVVFEGRVQAVSVIGSSPWSTVLTGRPRADVPNQVVGVIATSGENGQVPVRWEEPDGNGADVNRYLVQWRQANQAFNSSREREISVNEFTIPGQANGIATLVRVRAGNTAGYGVWSREQAATPQAPPPPPDPIPVNTIPAQVPSAPTGRNLGVSGILWDWPIPLAGRGKEQVGGQRITGFDAQWRVAGESWSGNIVPVTASCLVQTGLNSGQRYELRVRPRNAVGVGPWSETGSIELNVASIATLVGRSSGTSVDWIWNAVAGATGYQLETRQGTGEWRRVAVAGTQHSTSGHTAGLAVQGRVRAVVGTNVGPFVNSDPVPIIPARPAKPSLRVVTDQLGRLQASWDAPNDGGSPITSYDLRYRLPGGNSWTLISNATARTDLLHTTQPAQVQVRARNAVGVSGWSTSSDVAYPLSVPAPVRINTSQTWTWPWAHVSKATLKIVGGAGSGGSRGHEGNRAYFSIFPNPNSVRGGDGRKGEDGGYTRGGRGGRGSNAENRTTAEGTQQGSGGSLATRPAIDGRRQEGEPGKAGQSTKVVIGNTTYTARGGGGGGAGGAGGGGLAMEVTGYTDISDVPLRLKDLVQGLPGFSALPSGDGLGGLRGVRSGQSVNQPTLHQTSTGYVLFGGGGNAGAGGRGSSGETITRKITGMTTSSRLQITIGKGGRFPILNNLEGADGYVIITPTE